MTTETPRFATRLNSFRTGAVKRSIEGAIAAAAEVPGLTALELNYPQHFEGDAASTVALARDRGFEVTALNLRWDGPDFVHGAFTHPIEANRAKAIALAQDAVDVAAGHGVDHVILWMGPDGFDYPFQSDYAALWAMEIDGFRQIADRNPSIRVSVEYKPSDPRRLSLIRNMGDALLAVRDVDRPNFGATLDLCHALMAGESPAMAAAMALKDAKLFGVHLNDGYGPADDGMMVGGVGLWRLVELLHVLKRGGFRGAYYFDTFPVLEDAAAECAANIRMVKRLLRRLDDLDEAALAAAQTRQDAIAAQRLMQDLILGPGED